MRRLLALGSCAAYVAFGFVAGGAHVHRAADHHEEMRGLHLDHAHLAEGSGHEAVDNHEPSAPDGGEARLDAAHIGHHEGDALYLTVTAQRSFDPGLRVLPAMVVVGATIDAPRLPSVRLDELPDQLRGPPRNGPTPPRAPPA